MSRGAERLTVRPLTPGDDLEPELDLTQRAFGPFGAGAREHRRASLRLTVGAGRQVGAFDDGALVASARYFDARQWWRGRSLPMAAVAGVKVAPHRQGAGLGRAVVTALLQRMAGAGYPLSVLYPSTAPLYRSLGWEFAGGLFEATIPARSLRSLVPHDPVARAGAGGIAAGPVAADGVDGAVAGRAGGSAFRPAGPGDAAEMISVLSALYAAERCCGPMTFAAPDLAGFLAASESYVYLAPDGVLDYDWDTDQGQMMVSRAAAGSAATSRAMWSIVSSHATMVHRVRVVSSPADPVTWLAREPDVTLTRTQSWMLRLLDAPAAIAGRGFPASASLAVPLT
ncbi:MAG: GNAT family N-acetyltransferase, partial [Streptosporangiaceae bacterium]